MTVLRRTCVTARTRVSAATGVIAFAGTRSGCGHGVRGVLVRGGVPNGIVVGDGAGQAEVVRLGLAEADPPRVRSLGFVPWAARPGLPHHGIAGAGEPSRRRRNAPAPWTGRP